MNNMLKVIVMFISIFCVWTLLDVYVTKSGFSLSNTLTYSVAVTVALNVKDIIKFLKK